MKQLRLFTLLSTALMTSALWAAQFTITFQNWDGTTLQTGLWEKDSLPEYSGDTPTKPATQQYTYTFNGWAPEIYAVDKDQVYVAQFAETLNKYPVTFKNWDGTTLKSNELEYGKTPEPPADPYRKPDAEYTYKFDHWNPAIDSVTRNQIYEAVYSKIINKYTIIFKDYDGDTLQSGEWDYNATPIPPEDPSRDPDEDGTWTFKNWGENPISKVTGNKTYTAQYEKTKFVYQITFLNWNDEPLQITEYEHGTFPEFEAGEPTRSATNEYTYKFKRWVPDIVAATKDTVYKADYTPIDRYYRVTFDYGGIDPCDQNFKWHATPIFNCADAEYVDFKGNPIKGSTISTDYTFACWQKDGVDVDLTMEQVSGSVTYIARFAATPRQYAIKFMNVDGTIIQETPYDYGTYIKDIVPTATYSDSQYVYTFNKWNPAFTGTTKVTGTRTYTATYNKSLRKYIITFKNADEELCKKEFEYGQYPEYPEDYAEPTKASSDTKVFTFNGWSPEFVPVTGDATYTATYDSITRYYTIRFLNYDNTELASYSYEYGATPSYVGTPTKPASGGNSYIFDGWNPNIKPVTEDKDYIATFKASIAKYTVTYKNYEGTTLQTGLVPYNTMPSYNGTTPAKLATAEYTYTFLEWNPKETLVEGNQIYTAKFDSTPNPYDLTWVTDGDALTGSYTHGSTPYGTPIVAPNTPTKTGYTFTGWNNGSGVVTPVTTMPAENVIYTATWTANTYAIRFDGNNATSGTMSDQSFTYDEEAKPLTANAFARSYTITYNYNGGTGAPAFETATYTFDGWLWNATNYTDGQSVQNLTSTPNDTLTFVAQWTGGTVTLPTPTRTGYTF
ncbi:MAG: InlB B-repeat-containing protein, partial [Paludibacteraceae bacterium]|nr:InlB B-repeat-containing protein [Paludibacteraceae bacterium]